MNSVHAKAQKTLYSLQQDVQQLENGNDPTLSGSIAASMTTLQRHIRDMQDLVKREMSSEKRQEGKEKLGALEEEYVAIQKILETNRRKQEEKMQQQRERDELIAGSTASAGGSSSSLLIHGDAHQRIQNSVQRSITQVDQYIDMSLASLHKLHDQGYSLKTAQRRMLDVANTLGLSQTVIRWIERRTTEDKYIFWAGIIVTLLVMYFVIKYIVF